MDIGRLERTEAGTEVFVQRVEDEPLAVHVADELDQVGEIVGQVEPDIRSRRRDPACLGGLAENAPTSTPTSKSISCTCPSNYLKA